MLSGCAGKVKSPALKALPLIVMTSVVEASVNFTRTREATEARKAFSSAADALLEVEYAICMK